MRSKLILFLRKLACIKLKYKNSIITLLNQKIEYRAKIEQNRDMLYFLKVIIKELNKTECALKGLKIDCKQSYWCIRVFFT